MSNAKSVEKFFDLEAAGPDESESEDENGIAAFLASQNSEFSSTDVVRKNVPRKRRIIEEDSDDELQVEVEPIPSQDTVLDEDVIVPAPGPDDGVSRGPTPIDKRSRGWCFTLNNYTDRDERMLADFFNNNPKCDYLVYGREVGEQGTPHIQGYLYCEHARSGSAIRHAIGDRGHWEAAKGSPAQNRAYCTKQCTPANPVVEFGRLPQQGKGKPLNTLVKDRLDGVTLQDYIRDGRIDDLATFIRHHRGYDRLGQEIATHRCPRSDKVTVYWCYGPTGSGKSLWAYDTFPGAYYHPQHGRWFEGYRGEGVVIFDDFRPQNDIPFHWLLSVCDPYPLVVPIKGSSAKLQAHTIVFTSPERPENTFVLNEDVGQLLRRIGPNVKKFGDASHQENVAAQLSTNVFGN